MISLKAMGAEALRALGKSAHILYDLKYVLDQSESDLRLIYRDHKNEPISNCMRAITTSTKTWLITGVAGFIGSNLLETLLKLNQNVVGLDNFATGHQYNLDEVKSLVKPEQWENFKFYKGDIRNFEDCQTACAGVDYVLHQAALGSVPLYC